MKTHHRIVLVVALTVILAVAQAAVSDRTAPWLFSRLGVRVNLNLAGADLRGSRLRGRDLAFAEMKGADLRKADLNGAYLDSSDLSGADLGGADLNGARLRGAKLQDAVLEGADLRGADLAEATGLSPAQLERAQLDDATARRFNLRPPDDEADEGEAAPAVSLERVGGTIKVESEPYELAISNDGGLVAFAGRSPDVQLWRSAEGGYEPLAPLKGDGPVVRSVAVSPADGGVVASGDEGGAVKLWRVGEAAPFDTATAADEGYVFSIKFSGDGQKLFTARNKPALRRRVMRVSKLPGVVNSLSTKTLDRDLVIDFSPEGNLLAVAAPGQDARLLSFADGRELLPLSDSRGSVGAGAFSGDGSLLALGVNAGGARWKVQLWGTAGGQKIGEPFAPSTGEVESLAFTPDGRYLAAGWVDGGISLWRTGDGLLLHTIKAHRRHVYSMAFSGDGRFLASLGGDRTMAVWQVKPK
ncbi:MAG TPA: pentapeptide repeat-containing protein [Pyrinomonadaceae bacterium]